MMDPRPLHRRMHRPWPLRQHRSPSRCCVPCPEMSSTPTGRRKNDNVDANRCNPHPSPLSLPVLVFDILTSLGGAFLLHFLSFVWVASEPNFGSHSPKSVYHGVVHFRVALVYSMYIHSPHLVPPIPRVCHFYTLHITTPLPHCYS